MRRVKITLPATVTRLGTGANSLGMALGLHTTVEINERTDTALVVEPTGEGAGDYSIGLRHPVVLGMLRVFQHLERAPLGLHIRVDNRIPLGSGLGAEAAFMVAGVIGANNLMGNPFPREGVLAFAAAATGAPGHAVSAILGGLTVSHLDGETLTHRSLTVQPQQVVVALPELDHYADDIAGVVPEQVPLETALHNLRQLPLVLEALRSGDLKLLGGALDDRLYTRFYKPHIPAYDHVVEMATRAGARAATLVGSGPTLLIFAEGNHRKLAEAVRSAFRSAGVAARVWVLAIDTQGVVVSVAQTS